MKSFILKLENCLRKLPPECQTLKNKIRWKNFILEMEYCLRKLPQECQTSKKKVRWKNFILELENCLRKLPQECQTLEKLKCIFMERNFRSTHLIIVYNRRPLRLTFKTKKSRLEN